MSFKKDEELGGMGTSTTLNLNSGTDSLTVYGSLARTNSLLS